MKHRIPKFLASGGIAFAVEIVLFYILLKVLGSPLLVANSLSFIAGLIISFTLNRNWSFKHEEFEKDAHVQFGLYALLAGFNLLVSNIAVGTLAHIGLPPFLAKLVSVMIIATLNFFIYQRTIFKPQPGVQSAETTSVK